MLYQNLGASWIMANVNFTKHTFHFFLFSTKKWECFLATTTPLLRSSSSPPSSSSDCRPPSLRPVRPPFCLHYPILTHPLSYYRFTLLWDLRLHTGCQQTCWDCGRDRVLLLQTFWRWWSRRARPQVHLCTQLFHRKNFSQNFDRNNLDTLEVDPRL